MRALLVNPWIYDFKAFDFWNKPLGLLIVARILKEIGFEIEFIDCMDRLSPYFKTQTRTDSYGRGKYHCEVVEKPTVYKNVPRRYKRYGIPREIFIARIKKIETPDLIFITSSMTYWYLGVFEAIRLLKENFPKIPIILGGLYATLCRKHAENNAGADYIISGPAETELIKFLQGKGYIKKFVETKNLLPDFSLYESLNYGVAITSRGCPFNCTYCATRTLYPKYDTFDIKLLLKQIENFASKTKNIAFFDDALLCNPTFPVFLGEIINRRLNLNLHSSNGLHCRFINEKIARLMFKANFKTIYLSLETTNPGVQQKTGNKVTTAEFLNAVEILKKTGFSSSQLHVYLLYGLPGQSYEEIVDGIELCHSLGVHPHLCEFSPIPYTVEFDKTGFNMDTDPLYHNNHFYTWYYTGKKPEIYKMVKSLISRQ
ncbi:MAG: radical SAM protein [candidate division WOR-3 bacterium]